MAKPPQKRIGRPPKTPGEVMQPLTIRLPSRVRRALEIYARTMDLTLGEAVEKAVVGAIYTSGLGSYLEPDEPLGASPSQQLLSIPDDLLRKDELYVRDAMRWLIENHNWIFTEGAFSERDAMSFARQSYILGESVRQFCLRFAALAVDVADKKRKELTGEK
jgi:hypothetical protein